MAQMKIAFGFEARGLSSLERGWRTPDPSPTRTGLPKCRAPYPQEFIEPDVAEHDGKSEAALCNEELGYSQEEWRRMRTASPAPPNYHRFQEDRPKKVVLSLVACLPCERRSHADNDPKPCSSSEDMAPPSGSASSGSTGHPHSCAGGCKYFFKPKGCKEGANCDHCHLCHWKKPTVLWQQPPRCSRNPPRGAEGRRWRKHATAEPMTIVPEPINLQNHTSFKYTPTKEHFAEGQN